MNRIMDKQEALKYLASELSVLKPQEKQRYFYLLDEYTVDWAKGIEGGRSPEFGTGIASDMYKSLYGKHKTSPEFPSLKTREDLKADEKFHCLFAGVQSYTQATEEEKKSFKKSVLGVPSPIKWAIYQWRMLKKDPVL